ncbi:MAG: hypothetical protein IPN36_04590 [Bacteroidetes bacterium]|nr:hypothetical protein [Bacteroidota bacterium]
MKPKRIKKQLAVVLNGLGNSYLKSNDLDSALSCFTEACRINESLGEEVNVQFNKVNIAATQIELGRNKFKEGDSINGMKYALNAYATYKQITTDSNSFFNEYQMYDVSIIGADASMLVGKYDEGIGYATKAIENANKLETPEERMNAYEVLADIQQAKALTLNHAPDSMKDLLLLSFKNYKTSRELKDSLFNAENTTKIAEIRTKYESEKKDNEIVLLNKERELQEINLKEKQAIILLSRLQVAKNQDEIELLSKTRNLQELKLLTAEQELMVKEQTLKANAALLELEQKTKVIQQEQLSNEVLFRNMIIGSALILGLFGFLFFNRFKLQKQVEQHQKLIDQRKHIGADLHDDVGSTLSSISIYSEAIKTKLNLERDRKSDGVGS